MLKSLIILALLASPQARDLPLAVSVVPVPVLPSPQTDCEICKLFVEHVMTESADDAELICQLIKVCT